MAESFTLRDFITLGGLAGLMLMVLFQNMAITDLRRSLQQQGNVDLPAAHPHVRRLQVNETAAGVANETAEGSEFPVRDAVKEQCPVLYDTVKLALREDLTNELGYEADDETGVLRTIDGEDGTVVQVKEYYDAIGMFDLLTAPLDDLYKMDTLYLTFGEDDRFEKLYTVEEVTRDLVDPLVEIRFHGGDMLRMVPEGANLYDKDDMEIPIAVFAGPEYDPESDLLITVDEYLNSTAAAGTNATDGDSTRRLQLSRSFGSTRGQVGNQVFFNTGSYTSRRSLGPVTNFRAQRFQAMASGGRCRGTAGQCRGTGR
ncbi:unnamed protein product [Vitrella brassicaformis CCMP3155]|uniref:Uncharacterized protein n=1 Tax=Vitrella brassicaformis (strain CCMP3155) TaxID=1169540 RepID=A0A0G4EKK0_VITBC|nr:unnamed protein product [Vitrella brassicaformis CCMP3155]|eukprot:CEL97970.1 unnamed protein product [Vitrella brassicaformis CCMP3155]